MTGGFLEGFKAIDKTRATVTSGSGGICTPSIASCLVFYSF